MERDIIKSRIDHLAATDAMLTQMAVASLLDKKAGTAFQKMIRELVNG